MSQMSYRIHNGATGALKGYLTDDGTALVEYGGTGVQIVVDEPVIIRKINDGLGSIKLTLDRNWPGWNPTSLDGSPQILSWFDVIEVRWPGDVLHAGRFVFEGFDADGSTADNTVLELSHVVVDLQDTDCDPLANYTTVDQPGAPHLGVKNFGFAVTAQVPRTKHLSLGTVNNDGDTYALDYTHSKIRPVLDNAVNLGGPDWWWWCDYDGVVTVLTGARSTITLTTTQVEWVRSKGSVAQAYNVQQLSGRVDDTTGLPIQATRETTVGFWATGAIGRRVAPPYADPTIGDVTTLQHLGDNILSRSQTDVADLTVRTVGIRIDPGSKVVIPAPYGDGSTAYWVTQVTEFGSTTEQELVCSSQFGAYRSNATPQAPTWMDNLMSGSPWGGGGGGGGGGLIVAGGFVGGSPVVLVTSPDGITWTAATTPLDGGAVQAIAIG